MVWFATILLVIGLIVRLVRSKVVNPSDEAKTAKIVMQFASLGILSLSLLLFLFSSICIVQPEHIGVKTTFGEMSSHPISGFNIVNPYTDVDRMSIQTQTFAMLHNKQVGDKIIDDSVIARSSNGLNTPVDVTVPYRLVPEAAPWVRKNIGLSYDKMIKTVLTTSVQRASTFFTSEEIYSTKRDEFTNKVKSLIFEELNNFMVENYNGQAHPESVLVINQVLIGHVGLPDVVRVAIENKLKADQEQQTMSFSIMREKKEAERKEIEAGGIQRFQEIVVKGINENLLKWKAIEATLSLAASHNAKVVIIGSGKDGLPVILGNDQPK